MNSIEKATRFHEQQIEAGHEIGQGFIGIQGHNSPAAKEQSENDSSFQQLPSSAKVGTRVFEHVGQVPRPSLFW
jgi:hypothetical protein